jgi:hypothetical protein
MVVFTAQFPLRQKTPLEQTLVPTAMAQTQRHDAWNTATEIWISRGRPQYSQGEIGISHKIVVFSGISVRFAQLPSCFARANLAIFHIGH